ncbi:IclR family transcriptional regulator [Paenibacillus sp. GYB003]|uniref:IclR family transcriptional regulator n=1 Tax=Paenibacillus sp. GYB003 TaxID=2994392 RepID=UPI002F96C169
MATNKYNVPALEKAIAIIETLAACDEPIGVSELCKMVDIPKTSVFFILNTLDTHHYITKTEDGKYTLGNKFIHIGLGVLNKIEIREAAKPYMEKLLHETGFTVHLAVLDNGEAMYVEKVEKRGFVKFSTYIGQRLPLHASGVGKALAAHIPEEELDRIVAAQGLAEKTENTITNPQELKAELRKVRELGYAVDDEEDEYGIRCIGAPILDHRNGLKASISVTGLRADLPVHDIPRVGEQVKRSAIDISRLFGRADDR